MHLAIERKSVFGQINTVMFSHLRIVLLIMLHNHTLESNAHIQPTNCNLTKCIFTLENRSINYFHNRMLAEDPKLIKFRISLQGYHYNATPEAFEPNQWVWTYNSSRGMYPYLYWNVDYGVLSFGLLEAKTLKEHPYLFVKVKSRTHDNCSVTYGSIDTTQALACAFQGLLEDFNRPKYQNSYYCFLAERPGVRDTLEYKAAMYLLYPVDYINYNCCVTAFEYTSGHPFSECLPEQITKWPQCTILPYVLGIVLFLYFPIVLLRIADGITRNVKVTPREYEMIGVDYDNHDNPSGSGDEWIFLNEHTPYSISDCLAHVWCGFDKSHPILFSRVKRLLLTILLPSPVFIQMFLYNYNFEPGLIKKLVRHGTPMGFLTLLGEKEDRDKYFVPAFGGGLNILLAYGIIGLVIIVLPHNLKQVFEDGISKSSNTNSSPLCLGMWEIQELSMIPVKFRPGYASCADICTCSIYLLFSHRFWARVFIIQYNRISSFLFMFCSGRKILYLFTGIITPLYVLFCLIEICLCLIWYGFPFIRFVYVHARGLTINVSNKLKCEGRSNKMSMCMRSPFVFLCVSIVLFAIASAFSYTFCLIFVQGFTFISQVIVFCLVAVIVYPAISFGYLFFLLMLVYYVFHMIRGFGETYLMLLSEAVEISRNLDGEINCTTTFGNVLEVSNIKAQGINQIKIEGRHVCLPQNFFQTIAVDINRRSKIKLKNNMYGIPRTLFRHLIQKHKPANQQVLKIIFHFGLIVMLLAVTTGITSGFAVGPTSEISDVMHVIFIVTIGALPRVLEIVLVSANAAVKREIESRKMERTIVSFWQREEIK